MCTQRTPYNWSVDLYKRHGEAVSAYLTSQVLSSLKSKSDSFLLIELKQRWGNHLIMNKWMRQFFMYLDRYYVKHHSVPPLALAGLKHFKNLVFDDIKKDVTAAVLKLVDNERLGETVDRELLKSAVDLYEAMGMALYSFYSLDVYINDFEEQLLINARDFYARRREEWIEADSTPTYLIKAEEALAEEKNRVKTYLHSSSEAKLLRVVEEELLEKVESVLLEKEGSGCKVLLANDKTEDLERMFRLFGRLENGLLPMSHIVRDYIAGVGNEVSRNHL